MAASSRSLVSCAIRSVWRELRSTSSAPRRSSGLSMDRATCLLASKNGAMNGPYASKISAVGPMFFKVSGALEGIDLVAELVDPVHGVERRAVGGLDLAAEALHLFAEVGHLLSVAARAWALSSTGRANSSWALSMYTPAALRSSSIRLSRLAGPMEASARAVWSRTSRASSADW